MSSGISGQYRANRLLLSSISILLVVSLVGAAYAEQGRYYDRELLSEQDGLATYKWTSHYERIDDGTKWVNYLSSENSTHFIFESANISLIFDKSDCSFEMFNPGHIYFANQTQGRYTKQLKVDDVVKSPSCSVGFAQNADGYTFTTTQAESGYELKTDYLVTASGFVEWTYDPNNTDVIGEKKFTIIENCEGCSLKSVGNGTFELDSYVYDAKNSTHGTLKSVDTKTGLSLTFETEPLSMFDDKKIDPIFSENDPVEDGFIITTQTTGTACSTTPSSRTASGTTNEIFIHTNVANESCRYAYSDWDISTLPDNLIVISTTFLYEVTATSIARNCDYVDLGTVTSSDTDQDLLDAIRTGTAYVSNDASCTTVGTNKSDVLGSVANDDIEAQVLTSDRFALGLRFNNMVRDGSTHQVIIESEAGGSPTPAPTLEVLYVVPISYTAAPSITLDRVGDTARITNSQVISSSGMNVTSVSLLVNGTTITTNSTNHNGTAWPFTKTDTFWYRMTDNSTSYEFEVQVTTDPAPNMNLTNTLSYFTFDDTVESTGLADFGSEANHASVGAGTYSSVAGVINNATDLNGATRYTVPNESDYDFERTQAFSICGWARPVTGITNNDVVVSKMNTVSASAGYVLYYDSGNDRFHFQLVDSLINVFQVSSLTNSVPENEWVQYCGIFDGTSNELGMSIFLNGTDATNTATRADATISNSILNNINLLVGAQGNGGRLFDGQQDDIRIFDRELSATEVRQLYNLGSQKLMNLDYESQEYDPIYSDAEVVTQGDYNVTKPGGVLKLNRIVESPQNNTETWQVELCYRDWADVFRNTGVCTWYNYTDVAFVEQTSPNPNLDYYVTAYNEDLIFSNLLITANYSNYIVPGLVIIDSLGGFVGAPSVLLFVLAILSWGTGRNFPIVIVIAVSALGLMGALGLLFMTGQMWAIIFVIAGISVFGIRKFF